MTTMQKTKVQPTWDVARVRESAAMLAVNNVSAALDTVEALGPEAVKKYQEAWTSHKIAYLKKLNIKTPMELVKASAEFETNTFGSVIEIWGDDNNATYTYEVCGCFEVAKKNGMMTCEQGEKFGKFFAGSSELLAKAFGFTTITEHTGKDGMPVITFKK